MLSLLLACLQSMIPLHLSTQTMNIQLSVGQWQGFFTYGASYGQLLEGQEVEFRLFIEQYNNGVFSGKIIDWDGVGAEGEVAIVEGFLEGNLISFKKTYAHYLEIDEWGNSFVAEDIPGHTVFYEGSFNKELNQFDGKWEIIEQEYHTPVATYEMLASGTWRLLRVD